jgi:ribonuclease P protein component
MAGRVRTGGEAVPVRFGFTAARRFARLAVDRNTVKRVLREAARHSLAELDAAAGARQVDIVLRLKAAAPEQGRRAWKSELRAEAESLFAELVRRLRQDRTAP